MIIFHEGLPRSGKSYEAVVKHVIKALEEGRHIWSNVDGLYDGAEKLASIVGKTTEEVQALIHQFEPKDTRKMYEFVTKDSLVLVDELQDWYPSSMRNIPQEEMTFVTQHGHEGLDIIAMGQNLNDCNKLWRNRTERKVTFTKRTAIGKPDSYTWRMYAGQLDDKGEITFEKISSGGGEYDAKYFGTYKSHTDGTKNTSLDYKDKRVNVFSQKSFLVGVPTFIFVLFCALYYIYVFFTEPTFAQGAPEIKPEPVKVASVRTAPVAPKPEKVEYKAIDYLDGIAHKYQLRLSATIYDHNGRLSHAYIDAYDSTQHLKERFYLYDVRALGWSVRQKLYGLDLVKESITHVVRPFPLDDLQGRVNNHYANSL